MTFIIKDCLVAGLTEPTLINPAVTGRFSVVSHDTPSSASTLHQRHRKRTVIDPRDSFMVMLRYRSRFCVHEQYFQFQQYRSCEITPRVYTPSLNTIIAVSYLHIQC